MMPQSKKLPALVLAAFGASSPKAREVYGHVEACVRKAYPAHEIAWAYLSLHIVNKQRKLGVTLPTLAEALASLKASGFNQAVVQPLLVVPGEEFALVNSSSCDGVTLEIGAPLLTSEADIAASLAAIAPQVRQHIPHVLVCHGNKRHSEYNRPVLQLKKMAESAFDNLIVASVEGEPGTEPLTRAKEMAAVHGSVVFIPFMIAAGEHITRDVMGDEPESWKCMVGAGQSRCLEPLGKNASILAIFLSHIEAAMQRLRKARQDD
jgi:sirohydrochlorin cobaltochelatase